MSRPSIIILSSQVVSLPLQSVIQVANFCAAMDTLIDQDDQLLTISGGVCEVLLIIRATKKQVS